MVEEARTTERYWIRLTLLIFLAAATYLIVIRWNAILRFGLGDTDDNMRMAQVRALLSGQGWYDLRQYKLDPPFGANIHWTRLVDLPIAGLILASRPFLGGFGAEKFAAAVAPLIPLGVAMFGLAVSARRLIAPHAFALACALLLCGQAALNMFAPLRIDHHGWQLASLAWTVAGLADPRRTRGGLTVGFASAVSLTIGLELLPYVAMGAAAIALRWCWDRGDARRLTAYGTSLAAGCGFGYIVFASYADRLPVCDALSPVWLSVALVGGGLLVLLSRLPIERAWLRVVLGTFAGAITVAFYVTAWPHCVGMLEGLSPELKQKWFSHVREARPLYTHGWRVAVPLLAMPVMGLAGAAWATWNARRTPLFAAWAVVALFTLFACLMLLWQTRAGASAQLLSVPGAAALGWALLPRVRGSGLMAVRTVGTVAIFVLISGLLVQFVVQKIPEKPISGYRKAINRANGSCPSLRSLRPIAKLPAATVLTFVDFGPRLITVTHHKAIAGPYHRNGDAILDVQHAFRGTADNAHAIIRRHGATLVLLCPNMSEATIYRAENPNGFYRQLVKGQVPVWLQRVELPKRSPFMLWRVIG